MKLNKNIALLLRMEINKFYADESAFYLIERLTEAGMKVTQVKSLTLSNVVGYLLSEKYPAMGSYAINILDKGQDNKLPRGLLKKSKMFYVLVEIEPSIFILGLK
jgi:hypothetical protein